MSDRIVKFAWPLWDGSSHEVRLAIATYPFGGTWVLAIDDDGNHWGDISKCIPGVSKNLPANEICVKGYSENRGVPEALVAQGLAEWTNSVVSAGDYVELPVMKLLFLQEETNG